jgi:AraC-like DNA-binding protein
MTKKQKDVLKALEETHGIITEACKKAGYTRSAFYLAMEKDQELKKAVEDIQEQAIDYVESKLFENIQNKNVTAQIFYLKTKAKHRGYIERQEIQQETTSSITFDFN